MAKILLTGSAGLAGKALLSYLGGRGHELTAIVRGPITAPPGCRIVSRNLADQPLRLTGTFDAVIHAAACLPYRRPSAEDYWRDNVLATANLADFAARTGIKRFIHLSSIAVHGEFRETTVREDSDRVNPDLYGSTKFLAEKIIEEKMPEALSLRLPGLLGPGARGVWLADIAARLKADQPVKVYSPQFATGNFVHVDDLARFVERLLTLGEWPYRAVNLACLELTPVIDLVERLRRNLRSRSEIIIEDGGRRPFRLDTSRARALGYQSLTPLEIVDHYDRSAY